MYNCHLSLEQNKRNEEVQKVVHAIIANKSVEKAAEELGISQEKIDEALEMLKIINPLAYTTVQKMISNNFAEVS